MKQLNKYSFTILSMIALMFASCKQEQQQAPQQQALPLTVTEVPQKNVRSYTTYPTTIEGTINSEVRAKVSGYIQKVLVDEGQKVRKGQALFKLETQSLSQDANAAKARVNVAQVEVNKLKPLVEKNIISEVQLETAKANLAQAKSTYNSVVANIGYATVTSPVDGFVGAIPYREGSLVSATSAKPLTTVASIERVFAYFSMNETEYLDFLQQTEGKTLQDKIANFPKVELQLANGQTYEQKGTIETVTGQIDANTGTVSFRAVFDNPNMLLTNGNSGTIKIPNTYENALVVPQSATYEQQGQTYVYTVGEGNAATSTLITVEDKTDLFYIVNSGVKAGDLIVVKGIGKLRNGMPIQPQKVAFDSIVKPIKPLFQ
ncbi:MAG: efflux transporter periplasmic adaptor subunit [Xanthomarina sp.]|uniref:Efflux RND transporter periplasmic adaptor subunit n=1 Tax=Xanthomarina gelatinilytica TaxID=1137281 RepID=A0A3D6BR39_9FLAO|nr:efflux RND transporter periplasmic adaptor subunit [Xanthomarina sp.]MAL22357.1 efflux transporter periplasmic adaptor subunit [Xanthomarina sp.]MBF60972.1 efflux transporter periplasmic adaptor subunit [Xanthomarina sp.]HCY80515.1 efflux RND transporter periplasmic adaptor subunit [Xanthomarina gelatinilytica]